MRIISVKLENFASYESLEFNFENQGLTLIQGPTGAGKSTLCDAVAWCLFGITAKNGKADEIRPWSTQGSTKGCIELDNGLIITRVRGKQNDLYFSKSTMPIQRGKDLQDTQKFINQELGIDADLYLSGAYFHEFSQTSQFFNTTAKNRRDICEQIVDLSLAKKLQANISDKKKIIAKSIDKVEREITTAKSNIILIERMQYQESTKADKWQADHERLISTTINAYDKFESGRTRTIHKKCPTCNTELIKAHTVVDNATNPYLTRLEELNSEVNPYTNSVKDYTDAINTRTSEINDLVQIKEQVQIEYSDLELLTDITDSFRGLLIQNTINYVETLTNNLLIKHFDAEIKVTFTAADADKLEVEIQKDSNICSFTQLSKGQRQLLRLCFGVAVMQTVSNHNGVSFNTIFFDEAMSGLDDTFKLKAYKLLEELALNYENILVIDHSESFKAAFPNIYSIELVNGKSQICQH